MQDPRIRLGVVLLLSIVSFLSLTGAFLTVVWWLTCTNRRTSFHDLRTGAMVFMLPAIAAIATEWSGGDGVSYLIRISIVLVIASWAYNERYPGELLDVSVWLFGRRNGFDLGLVGEMSISTIEILADELRRTRIALSQKDQRLSGTNLPPIIASLLVRQLRLARERADVLALRGYQGGGSLCPSFVTSYFDIGAGAFCVLILAVSVIL
ncbi:hypothetical protein [Methanospirillum lacunae]|uniref:Energy-coupling factor transporter transmembrane protein EcfT n=1 Tax=Methanospirillum lacunae TaxID=668570 RepID=A0A2V2N4V7_9EURY|nr:hypothetical protein [Methanospirillum lacunae]PWR70541.1 hypothetical protein DK846_14200 [Methanospirillum lacunae]